MLNYLSDTKEQSTILKLSKYRDWDNKVKVGGFERVYTPLRLGMLSGNRFSVALRFIPADISNEAIAKSTLVALNKF